MPSVCFCKTRVMGAGSGSWGVHQTRDSDGAALEGDPSKLVPLLHKRPSGTPRNPERSEKAGDGAFLACREKRGTRRCVIVLRNGFVAFKRTLCCSSLVSTWISSISILSSALVLR